MKSKRNFCRKLGGWVVESAAIGLLAAGFCAPQAMAAQTELDDIPANVSPQPPANLLLTPSVEFPTALVRAHKGNYSANMEYLGYFDPDKCYKYTKTSGLPTSYSDSNGTGDYFYPVGKATNRTCSGTWSGNALNFATMGGIDPFRWALTGGNRVIDRSAKDYSPNGLTVLRRAYQSGQGGDLSNITIPTPYGNLAVTSSGRGSQFFLTISNKSTYFQAQVQVCDPSSSAGGLESNCREYKDKGGRITYKPVGLIQRYEEKIRFGVFGYLYNQYDSKYMKGGVLRARLKSVGPKNWDGTVNSSYEWDEETGVFRSNPDDDDSKDSKVTNSGVINYLNQFGFSSKGYEVFDQPSEMYAEALRYLMNEKAATAAYYNPDGVSNPPADIDSRRKDGFPVIINWTNDPILNYCQNNAILGIGDVNTHNENNFSNFGNRTSGKAVDWTNKVGQLEGMGNISNSKWNTGDGGSYMIAGLAYYAHVNDIRPDLTSGKNRKMTVDTFWVDVLETGYVDKRQYWLAAKYGGFKDVNNNGVFDSTVDTWKTQGRTYNGYTLPDNYYAASEPKAMVTGLESAFAQISKSPTLGMRAGVTWQPGAGSAMALYSGGYTTGTWSGSLTAAKFKNFKADNTAETELVWDAATKIDEQAAGTGWDTGRRIVTKNAPGNAAAVPFRFDSLTAEQKAALGGNAVEQQAVLNYLRGKSDNEGTTFRQREHVLGDIVDSRTVYVGAPDAVYSDATNPGYAKFKSDNATRKEIVYAGANDGMLHAVNAALTGTDAGKEHWAYIPSLLYRGPSDPSAPDVDGLQALSRPSYSHRYYVNATPVIADVDFKRIDDTGKGGTWTTTSDSDWRTLLVGGLGKGGKGFYAIDVTKPGDVTTEAAAAGKVLWEFAPGDDMGFSFGRPLITKTKAWGWVVIVTSGYNNTTGKGILYVLNPKNGEALATVDTKAGSSDNPAGLTQVSGYTQSYADYTTDQVYAGDLLGNLWRFDFNDPKDAKISESVTVHKLAELTDKNGNPQPVTAPPVIEWYPDNEHRWVFVGTGQFLAKSDVDNSSGTQKQTFYGIRDGSREQPGSGATLGWSDLTELKNLSAGFTEVPEKGWYYVMTGTLNKATERVTYSASVLNGTVVWTGLMPQLGSDPCSDSMVTGKSHIYAVDFESGKASIDTVVNDYWFDTQLVEVDGKVEVIGTTGGGGIGSDGKQKPPGAERLGDDIKGTTKLEPAVINWRRIN